MTTYSLTVPVPLLTTNRERNGHFRERAAYVKEVRTAAHLLARVAHWPQLTVVRVEAQPGQARGRLADAAAHLPTVKAILDGIVDAGVLEDDDPKHVRSILFHAPVRSNADFLTLTLIPSDNGVH